MIETRGIFLRKEEKLSVQKCMIEAVITIPESEFKEFQNSLYERQSFILDNLDKMYVGKSGEFHTILVVGDESSDGVLVESEGYDYGRCVSFLPEAKAFLKRKMEELTDKIVTDQRKGNSDELVRIRFSELSETYGIDVSPNQGLFSYLLPALTERKEIRDVYVEQEGFLCSFVPLCQEEGYTYRPNGIRLMELLDCTLEEFHLLPEGIDEMPLTIIELNDKTLTENGKTEWSDVLNAGVKRIYQGYYGLQIDLTGVKASRIYDFSAMLAGYCPIEDYCKWVREDSFLPGQKMTFD